MYYTYLIYCADNALYTGISRNLRKRLKQHNLGEVPFTKNKRPVKLVYWERFNSRTEAARREKEIKGWRREKKEALIEKFTLSPSGRSAGVVQW